MTQKPFYPFDWHLNVTINIMNWHNIYALGGKMFNQILVLYKIIGNYENNGSTFLKLIQ